MNICADCTVLETQHFDVVVDALYGTDSMAHCGPPALPPAG